MWELRDYEHLLVIYLKSCSTLKKMGGGWFVGLWLDFGTSWKCGSCLYLFWYKTKTQGQLTATKKLANDG